MDRAGIKKPRAPRAKKLKVDLTSLPDAIVDGKLTVPVNGKVVFVRSLDQKQVVHKGYVFSVDLEKGDVTLWDETREQFYSFNVKEPPVIKVIS